MPPPPPPPPPPSLLCWNHFGIMYLHFLHSSPLKVRSHMRGRARAEAGGKLASTQIITRVHTCTVAKQRRSGSKIHSTRNGSNTQFAASASKPRAPNHHCPQEIADPPASAPRMCEHTRGSRAGMSKSARLRSATAPRMCERSFRWHRYLNAFLKEGKDLFVLHNQYQGYWWPGDARARTSTAMCYWPINPEIFCHGG